MTSVSTLEEYFETLTRFSVSGREIDEVRSNLSPRDRFTLIVWERNTEPESLKWSRRMIRTAVKKLREDLIVDIMAMKK